MKRFSQIAQIHPLRRVLASLKICTIQRYALARQLWRIKNEDILYNQDEDAGQYSDSLSYSFRLFNLAQPHSLHQFCFYSDQQIGGDSSGRLVFDHQDGCLLLEGAINSKEKEKLTSYPSIGMALRHPYPMRCGPFSAISATLHSDGRPIHFGVKLRTTLSGIVSCYGIIASKIRGWNTYEIPFTNMILVGSEEFQHLNDGFTELIKTGREGTVLGNDRTDMRKLMTFQATEAVIEDINIRLLENESTERRVAVRSIDLIHRAQSKQFARDYLHPFLYLTERPSADREDGFGWLKRGYSDFRQIDLGDKKYLRKK